jgi:hypothetical protein
VGNPIEVSGIGRAFEGTISIRVRDGNGSQLIETHTLGGSMGTFGEYRKEVSLGPIPATPHGTVEVFEHSAKDGSEIHKVTVRIVFGRSLMGGDYTGFDVYEVQSGDSLSTIAQELYGDATKWPRIHEANVYQIDDPNLIYPGQALRIPR